MKILIITGGSRGIGLALANHYHQNNYKVFSLARTISNDFPFTQLKVDLLNTDISTAFSSILNGLNLDIIEKITLINNAGRLGQIANLETVAITDISKTIHLNITIPLQLTSLFIKETKQLNCKKTIINISSGAGVKAYQGWSAYCASKAAIDMLTKVTALENKDYDILAIRPGIVATNMQKQIRNTDKKDFIAVDRFIELYENKKLSNPLKIAEKIYRIDIENKFNSGDCVRLN